MLYGQERPAGKLRLPLLQSPHNLSRECMPDMPHMCVPQYPPLYCFVMRACECSCAKLRCKAHTTYRELHASRAIAVPILALIPPQRTHGRHFLYACASTPPRYCLLMHALDVVAYATADGACCSTGCSTPSTRRHALPWAKSTIVPLCVSGLTYGHT